jgi:hypothetical protein
LCATHTERANWHESRLLLDVQVPHRPSGAPDCPFLGSYIREANEKHQKSKEKNVIVKIDATEAEVRRRAKDIYQGLGPASGDSLRATQAALADYGIRLECKPEKVAPVRDAQLTEDTELRDKMTVVTDSCRDTYTYNATFDRWQKAGDGTYYAKRTVLADFPVITFEGVK